MGVTTCRMLVWVVQHSGGQISHVQTVSLHVCARKGARYGARCGARKVCPIISGHVFEGLVVTPPKCDFSQ